MDASDLYLAFKSSGERVLVGNVEETAEWAIDTAKRATQAIIKDADIELYSIRKTANSLVVDLPNARITQDMKAMFLNDYPEAIDERENYLHIDISENIPMRKVSELIRISTLSDLNRSA